MILKSKQTTAGLAALLIVLSVPLVTLITSKFIQFHLDDRWQNTIGARVQQQSPETNLSESELKSLVPTALCRHSDLGLQNVAVKEFCTRLGNFLLIDTAALAVAGFGILTLLVFLFAGWVARLNAKTLRFGFNFSMWLARFMVVTLLIADSILALATFYYSEAILTEQVNLYSMAAIAFLIGIIVIRNSTFALVDFRPKPFKVPGQRLTLGEHNLLQAWVTEVFQRCGSPIPDNVIAGIDFILFATDVKLQCLNQMMSGRSLFLPLPLCRLLTKGELSALIAHELAHHRSPDENLTRHFYPGFEALLHDLDSISHSPLRLVVFPVTSVMKFLLGCFLRAESTLTRARELAADRFASEKFGRENLATALVKLYAFTATWDYVEEEMRGFLAEGKQIVNSSEFFAALASITSTEVFLKHIALSTISHPTDRHPLLGERLGALDCTVQGLSDAALGPKAQKGLTDPAINLIQDYKKLEESLTNVDHLKRPHAGPAVAEEISKMFEPQLHSSPEDHEREIA